MENWCHPCQQSGKDVVGKFFVAGRFYCFAHSLEMRKKERESAPADGPMPAIQVQPAPETSNYEVVAREEPKSMTDYAALQKDRDSGMTVKAIAEKHKTSPATVYNNTKKPAISAPAKKPGRLESLANATSERRSYTRKNKLPDSTKKDAAFSSNSTIYELLAKLRARRDSLNEAITALEMVEKLLAHSEELA
jgi:hypothetical protein